MRRLSTFALALVTVAGCTFPDVTISDKPGDSSVVDGGNNDAKIDSTVGDGADASGDTTFGDSDEDAQDTTPVLVDTNPADVTAETNPCDKDGDGYQIAGAGCTPGTKGVDCDDLTFAANPGVKDYVASPVPSTLKPPGDWNCDGIAEKKYTVVSTCPGLFAGCDTRGGVQAVTECGTPIKLVTCAPDGLNCKDGAISDSRQGCK